MRTTRFDRITKVLRAVERSETAQLKAKLHDIANARKSAEALRRESASGAALKTVAEMQAQSARQRANEYEARHLEQQALQGEAEAHILRQRLAATLGRIRAADVVQNAARKTEDQTKERRAADDAILRRKRYGSRSTDASAGSQVGTE